MAAKSGDIPDFSAIQYYLRSSETLAPGFKAGGINADYAWQYYGGKGEGITVVSQEIGAWDDKHVDLPPRAFSAGSVDVHYHDTAAVGIMAAKDNGAGIVGIAHKATFGYAAYNASVFYELIDKLKPGDVVQVGLHIDIGSVANCQRYCFVPDEYTPHRFDEIRALTDRGIHVIEAAGNGNVNLDHPDFNHKFDRNYRDSGAIIVGALDPETGGKAWFSFQGSRVDNASWGDHVVTTTSSELGDLWIKPHASYMSYFGGTSSANPIVAGATASLSGFAKAHNLILKPKELRRILVETGMPLANNDSAKVGTQPNLEKAFKKILLSEVEVPTVAVSRSTINAVVAHDTEVLYPISATSNQQGNVNWQWERISGDSRIFIKDSSAAETQVVIPKNLENVSTRFRVTATNSQGKKAGSDVEINVTSPKVTIVGTSIMESIHPLTLKASANFDQVVYNWSLSKDGQNVPKGINASGIIKSNLPAGDYIVKVEARSDKGQRHAQATHRVKITLDDLTGTPAWDKDKVYSTPCTEVRYNGSIWKNGWWTKNEAPDSESPWGVWRKKGSANMHAGC